MGLTAKPVGKYKSFIQKSWNADHAEEILKRLRENNNKKSKAKKETPSEPAKNNRKKK